MTKTESIVSFDQVSFEYSPTRPILDEVDFSIRQGRKITLMGQNGAGKSTIFALIAGLLKADMGKVNIGHGLTIAMARQVILREEFELTVRDFFQRCFAQKVYNIDPKIDEVLEVVNLHASHDKLIKTFSGGQQARLLLASALIQNPDLLLLDEPTNNLDKAGIAHLRQFLVDYKKTVIVISHDAEFLNAFTDGVLYLDVHTRKVEQYTGNYFDVSEQILARIERENRKNAQLAKKIIENKEKANYFADKGGRMRLLAKRMRDKAEEMEEEKVDVRKEDKAIRPFVIPRQEGLQGEIVTISSFTAMNKKHKPTTREANILLRKDDHLLLKGPNGIGKSTLLESIVRRSSKGITVGKDVKIGYYRQDFSTLNFDDTVYQSLISVTPDKDEEYMRSVAAGFLINSEVIRTKIGNLSEGQKGLVAFAHLIFEKPGLLILDEPTNHMNFRHIPIIAEALNKYEGAMILVSHVPEFVEKIRIDRVIDLEE